MVKLVAYNTTTPSHLFTPFHPTQSNSTTHHSTPHNHTRQHTIPPHTITLDNTPFHPTQSHSTTHHSTPHNHTRQHTIPPHTITLDNTPFHPTNNLLLPPSPKTSLLHYHTSLHTITSPILTAFSQKNLHPLSSPQHPSSARK